MSTGLIDLQRRFRELGRLRMGAQETKGGKTRPVKLLNWRLTSHSRYLLEAAAIAFGGVVRVWENAPSQGENFELLSESSSLPIIVPPGHVLSQSYELWSGGGCKRRCGGPNEEGTARQADRDVACACPLDINERMEQAQRGLACKPTTRLSVILPDIPDIGVWRLESHGYNAAVELAGTYELCRMSTAQGQPIGAVLSIQQRESKKEGLRRDFIVPIIEIKETIGNVLESFANAALPANERKQLPAAQPPLAENNGGALGSAEFPARAPIDPSEPVDAELVEESSEPAGDLAPWVLELIDLGLLDGEIIDAANAVAAEAGAPATIESLADLSGRNVSVASQQAIRKRLEASLAEQGTLA